MFTVKGTPCTKNTRDCPTHQSPFLPAAADPLNAARATAAIPAETEQSNIIRRRGAAVPLLPNAPARAGQKRAAAR